MKRLSVDDEGVPLRFGQLLGAGEAEIRVAAERDAPCLALVRRSEFDGRAHGSKPERLNVVDALMWRALTLESPSIS